MPLTLIVTRDVPARYRGFLASVMPELAPGVYIAPDLSKGVRERVWTVLVDWWEAAPGAAVVMAFPDKAATGRLAIRILGTPPVELAELDGLWVVARREDQSGGAVAI